MTADKPNGHDNDGNPIQYSVSNRADTPRIYYAIWEDYSIDDEEEVDESGFCSGAISTEGGGNLHWETNQFQVVHKDDYDALAARVKELEAERDRYQRDWQKEHTAKVDAKVDLDRALKQVAELKAENADLERSRAMLSRQEKEYLDRCSERDKALQKIEKLEATCFDLVSKVNKRTQERDQLQSRLAECEEKLAAAERALEKCREQRDALYDGALPDEAAERSDAELDAILNGEGKND